MSDYSHDFGVLHGASQENVLTMLIWNEQYAPQLASVLRPELFGDKNQEKLAEAAIRFIEVYRRPAMGHIRDLLEDDLKRPGSLMGLTIDATERLAPELDPDYVMSDLDRFIRIRQRKMAIDEALRYLNQGDEEKADEVLWSRTGHSFDNDMTAGTWLHDTDLSFLRKTETDFFSSGIEVLDERGIVPARGTMMMFIAPKKAGKSWFCIGVGKAGVRFRRKTLHISLENSAELTKRRYIQAFWSMTKKQALEKLNMPYFERDSGGEWTDTKDYMVMPLALTVDNEEYVLARLREMEHRTPLLIKQFATNTLTLPRYNAYLDNLERRYKFVPDLVIMDYPDLMNIDEKTLRVSTGRMFSGLRGVAVDRNHALICPTQGNRASQDSRWVTSKNVSEDWSKAGIADIVVTFSRTEQEKKRQLARLLVDAARDEEDGFRVMITQSYATGQFCVDSIFMNSAVTQESDSIIDDRKQDTEDQEED